MKDPAFLFYYQDFIFGTSFMSNEEVGAYIKVLCFLADKGKIAESQIKAVCGSQEVFNVVIQKLEKNGDDTYHQKRLTEEVVKRKKFTESRRHNKSVCASYDEHMENENEDINEIKNKEKEEKFKSEVYEFLKLYPEEMLKEFIEYWSELNKSRTQLKYELEKTWDLGKRLARWARNDKVFKKTPTQREVYKRKEYVFKDDNITPSAMPERLQKLAVDKMKWRDK